MQIHLNGKEHSIETGLTLLALITSLQLDPAKVVAEHNRRIVPAAEFGTVILGDGDSLELLQFVGGG